MNIEAQRAEASATRDVWLRFVVSRGCDVQGDVGRASAPASADEGGRADNQYYMKS